jgi:hypothetical protein
MRRDQMTRYATVNGTRIEAFVLSLRGGRMGEVIVQRDGCFVSKTRFASLSEAETYLNSLDLAAIA